VQLPTFFDFTREGWHPRTFVVLALHKIVMWMEAVLKAVRHWQKILVQVRGSYTWSIFACRKQKRDIDPLYDTLESVSVRGMTDLIAYLKLKREMTTMYTSGSRAYSRALTMAGHAFFFTDSWITSTIFTWPATE
jgi:hypothetical protein